MVTSTSAGEHARQTPSLLVEHSGGTVLAAPVAFFLCIGGFAFALLRPEGTPGALTQLGLLLLLLGSLVWSCLFYVNPRRIEVKAGLVTILYFNGRARTCRLNELSWLRPTGLFDRLFGVERVSAPDQGFTFRVWTEYESAKAFLALLREGP